MTRHILGLLVVGSLSVVGCGGGSSSPAGCGQYEPCGGDVVATWNLIGGCFNQAALSSQVGGTSCPGIAVSVSGLSVSGAVTFNADMTYTTSSAKESFTMTETFPASCLSGTSCAALTSELQSTIAGSNGIQSVSCAGTSDCTCTIIASMDAMGESGTYTTVGTTLTTTPASGSANSTGYCVNGKQLHLISVDTTMNTGPMGQATIDTDIMATRE